MRSFAVGVVALVAAGAVPARAQTPTPTPRPAVALVLAVRGATAPDVKPYREMRAGDRVRLYSGARLVVLQYDPEGQECRTLTIENGVVTFRRGSPLVEGGVVSTSEAKCPRRHPATFAAGAVLMRGVLTAAPMSPTPAFNLVGARAGEIAWIRVLDEGGVLTEFRIPGPVFTWPTDRAPLAANQIYTLEFLAANTEFVARLDVFTGGHVDPAVVVLE